MFKNNTLIQAESLSFTSVRIAQGEPWNFHFCSLVVDVQNSAVVLDNNIQWSHVCAQRGSLCARCPAYMHWALSDKSTMCWLIFSAYFFGGQEGEWWKSIGRCWMYAAPLQSHSYIAVLYNPQHVCMEGMKMLEQMMRQLQKECSVHVAGWWKTSKVTHLITKITGSCRCQGCFGSRLLLQCAAEGAWDQQPWPCTCNQLPYIAWRSKNTGHESRNSPISPAITPQQPFTGALTSLHRFQRFCCASFPCICHW